MILNEFSLTRVANSTEAATLPPGLVTISARKLGGSALITASMRVASPSSRTPLPTTRVSVPPNGDGSTEKSIGNAGRAKRLRQRAESARLGKAILKVISDLLLVSFSQVVSRVCLLGSTTCYLAVAMIFSASQPLTAAMQLSMPLFHQSHHGSPSGRSPQKRWPKVPSCWPVRFCTAASPDRTFMHLAAFSAVARWHRGQSGH